MTKKDYIIIADAISKAESRAGIIAQIAAALARDNPRFDRERFIRACGQHFFPWSVGLTDTGRELGRFQTHDEGSTFIGTLPNHETGCYYLDGPGEE